MCAWESRRSCVDIHTECPFTQAVYASMPVCAYTKMSTRRQLHACLARGRSAQEATSENHLNHVATEQGGVGQPHDSSLHGTVRAVLCRFEQFPLFHVYSHTHTPSFRYEQSNTLLNDTGRRKKKRKQPEILPPDFDTPSSEMYHGNPSAHVRSPSNIPSFVFLHPLCHASEQQTVDSIRRIT